jgi:hypothetical protein
MGGCKEARDRLESKKLGNVSLNTLIPKKGRSYNASARILTSRTKRGRKERWFLADRSKR